MKNNNKTLIYELLYETDLCEYLTGLDLLGIASEVPTYISFTNCNKRINLEISEDQAFLEQVIDSDWIDMPVSTMSTKEIVSKIKEYFKDA